MTTDFRALCAKLLQGLDENRHPEVRYPGHLRLVMGRARAALAEPEPPAVAPIPVSERSPNEEDCDEKGRCWHAFLLCGDPTWTLDDYNCIPRLGSTHWLPANALPLLTGDDT